MLSILFLIFVLLIMAVSVKKSLKDSERSKELESMQNEAASANLDGEKGLYDISKYIAVDSKDMVVKNAAGAFCDFFSECIKSGDFDSLSAMVNYDFIKSYSGCELDEEAMQQGILSVCTPSEASFCLSDAVLFTDTTDYADGIMTIRSGYNKGSIDSEAIRYKEGFAFNILFFLDEESNIKSFVFMDWLDGEMGSVDLVNKSY